MNGDPGDCRAFIPSAGSGNGVVAVGLCSTGDRRRPPVGRKYHLFYVQKVLNFHDMRYRGILLVIINIFAASTLVKGQSYNIKSLEGRPATINFHYIPATDSSDGSFFINFLKDTLYLYDYLAIDTVKLLNEAFLDIEYARRGGSNEGFSKQLLLCVSEGKLCPALHVDSYTNWDNRNAYQLKNASEYLLFKLGVTLSGNNSDSYKLKLNIHNEYSGHLKSKANYKYDRTKFLLFDKQSKAFYSGYEQLTGDYTFCDLKEKIKLKKYIKSKIPVVEIEKEKYYFINGNWYIRDKSNFFSMKL
ncbi:hypothetical protein ACQ86N_26450 [Puia sp. P3]|uniref:hypothetical protein n=1 Tax=Puia sp. P3 TaxID=3423952 RepID=UPI003D670441